MIANITTGGNANGMAEYNDKKTKTKDEFGNPEGVFLGMHNGEGTTAKQIAHTLNQYNKLNPNVKKPNIHISLSFHKDDLLDNNTMKRIAKDYLDDLGLGSQPYAVYRHFDTEHPHIHIVSSMIQLDGKKINDSHLFYRSQSITRKLEEEYQLTKAVNKSMNTKSLNVQDLIDNYFEFKEGSLVNTMDLAISEVLKLRPTSKRQLDYELGKFQIVRLEEEGKGNSYSLLPKDEITDPLNHRQRAVPAHNINKDYTIDNIDNILKVNAKDKQHNLKNVMGRVYSVFNKLEEKQTLSDLETSLIKKGIKLNVKRRTSGDKEGQINGLIFTDSKTNLNYTASELKLKQASYIDYIIDEPITSNSNLELIKSSPERIYSDTARNGDSLSNDSIIDNIESMIEALRNSQDLSQDQEALKKKKRKKRRGL